MDQLLSLLHSPEAWIALAALIAMEVVLGIDNLIFIAILTNRLPEPQRRPARRIGIGAALVLRLLLLSAVAFIVSLTRPVLEVMGQHFSWRDLILITGGLFLVWKATREIHHRVDPAPQKGEPSAANLAPTGITATVVQILLLDLVFSVDSIITAVGMTIHLPIMFLAVIVAVLIMLIAADPLSRFIEANPTIIMLALGFLLLIGTTLIADGFGFHVPRGYVYASMTFSAFIEALNMMSRRARRER